MYTWSACLFGPRHRQCQEQKMPRGEERSKGKEGLRPAQVVHEQAVEASFLLCRHPYRSWVLNSILGHRSGNQNRLLWFQQEWPRRSWQWKSKVDQSSLITLIWMTHWLYSAILHPRKHSDKVPLCTCWPCSNVLISQQRSSIVTTMQDS